MCRIVIATATQATTSDIAMAVRKGGICGSDSFTRTLLQNWNLKEPRDIVYSNVMTPSVTFVFKLMNSTGLVGMTSKVT